ncbi:hypothetical protein PTSG_08731 [Salpingoeca rosetta]|uniref:CCZ1/INTU/HSP4 first Longin domain-containing protein n=1 Tax=Salpingoeca rosetta (strain ATCC 50818 / BSB-021) TaxID=946362 RepID=F2UKJ1_SALR5|nr:uncharacterized protein PTSG_08731 [Salpingoeca rosetta]EGD77640.1 hypothetical protein PTSG_08731 [Salpingoeca rosetta]|eukprot:XP_004990116.1 hypothetical protein PTSG_08731 [Salpingoeca rosetta]
MAQVKHFSVFNDTFGLREDNEEEKIMYFFPPQATINEQMKSIGLSMAFINFARPFSPDKPAEVVHTKQTRLVFLSPEPHFWLAMTFLLPYREDTSQGKRTLEFLEDDVQDTALQMQLQQAYDMFKLFHGPMQALLDSRDRQGLMTILDTFFTEYFANLRLNDLGVVDAFHGMQFLPLDKRAYLRSQSFINALEIAFPAVKRTLLLYNRHLVWSGLSQQDTRLLYWYLVGGFLRRAATSPTATVTGGTLTCLLGPEDFHDDDSPVHAPACHVAINGNSATYRLIVYQYNQLLCCLFLDPAHVMDLDLHAYIREHIHSNVAKVEEEIRSNTREREAEQALPGVVSHKFLYFNFMNQVQKSTFLSLLEPMSQLPLSADDQHAVHIMGRLHHDLAREAYDCELIAKTESDGWVVARKADQREVFVILTNRHTNLIEIEEEMKKMCAVQFNSIFFANDQEDAQLI